LVRTVPVLPDPFTPWLESSDGASTRELIARDASDKQLVLRAARLAFYYGRMDGVALAHGKAGAEWGPGCDLAQQLKDTLPVQP
jgi:hypothetical protein